jgi:flagellar hook-associated protein 1 FlgK
MGGLFGSLNSSLQALKAFETALQVSQNNVSNASTPGYSRQTVELEAEPCSITQGLTGGVKAGAVESTDNIYADQAVRDQFSQQANYNAQNSALGAIQSLFDVSGQSGVIGALNNLFQSFSAWSATPSSTAAQQAVLNSAQTVAQSFQSTAASLSQTTTNLDGQITSTVQQINALASQIQQDNAQIANNATPDAGLQANLQANLQNLSQLADVTVTYAPNGSVTVLLGGQTPLVSGNTQYSIQSSFTDPTPGPNPNAIQDAHVLDASGHDITGQISQGSLAGLLTVRNTVLPSLQGNGTQQGALNQLAQTVADSVNSILTAAQAPSGAAGIPLFTYNNASPVDVGPSLTVNPSITIGTLAPVDPGPPPVSNGAALALSNLGESINPAYQINGQTIVQFAASTATQVGQQASDAQNNENLHTTLLTQAQALQTQISGVSLDQEAITVMELQKGYEAAGKMVTVIDSLTNTLINMVT